MYGPRSEVAKILGEPISKTAKSPTCRCRRNYTVETYPLRNQGSREFREDIERIEKRDGRIELRADKVEIGYHPLRRGKPDVASIEERYELKGDEDRTEEEVKLCDDAELAPFEVGIFGGDCDLELLQLRVELRLRGSVFRSTVDGHGDAEITSRRVEERNVDVAKLRRGGRDSSFIIEL